MPVLLCTPENRRYPHFPFLLLLGYYELYCVLIERLLHSVKIRVAPPLYRTAYLFIYSAPSERGPLGRQSEWQVNTKPEFTRTRSI